MLTKKNCLADEFRSCPVPVIASNFELPKDSPPSPNIKDRMPCYANIFKLILEKGLPSLFASFHIVFISLGINNKDLFRQTPRHIDEDHSLVIEFKGSCSLNNLLKEVGNNQDLLLELLTRFTAELRSSPPMITPQIQVDIINAFGPSIVMYRPLLNKPTEKTQDLFNVELKLVLYLDKLIAKLDMENRQVLAMFAYTLKRIAVLRSGVKLINEQRNWIYNMVSGFSSLCFQGNVIAQELGKYISTILIEHEYVIFRKYIPQTIFPVQDEPLMEEGMDFDQWIRLKKTRSYMRDWPKKTTFKINNMQFAGKLNSL